MNRLLAKITNTPYQSSKVEGREEIFSHTDERIEVDSELPLLELFTRLRQVGLPLGIHDYQLVLQALQAGFGVSNQAALQRLCETLWIKSPEERQLFEYHFEQVMGTPQAIISTSKTQIEWSRIRISLITRYLILGILGVGIVSGVGLIIKQQTQTPTLAKIAQPTVTSEANPIVQSTVASQPIQDNNQLDWIFWSLLWIVSLGVLGLGYALFRWISQRNAKQPVSQSTSVSKSHLDAASSPLSVKVTQKIEDEIQVAQVVLQATNKNGRTPASRFILSSEYFPVTERQMKQIWRYLRRPVREGAATELDVEATIDRIGHQGLFLEPVLVPPRVNRAELLLLIDQDGSMIPFHTLSRRLADTALRGGHLGRAGIYYFHNCPIEYLYHDPNHQEAELISDTVTHSCSNKTAVLIFSDAGAARSGYSDERYELTKEFLTKLRQRVCYIAWLNPMPRERWNRTTAGEIARLIPMFELSRRGMQDAIGVLRGRPTNFEGQKK